MVDVILILILVAFFALAVLFVKACERIVGPDVNVEVVEPDAADEAKAA